MRIGLTKKRTGKEYGRKEGRGEKHERDNGQEVMFCVYNNVHRKSIGVKPWGFCPVEQQVLM
jgi:hypothetical protein